MKGARRAREGSRSSGNLGKGRVLKSGKSIIRPPMLKPGQVRCHACRNAATLNPSGDYRQHRDLFDGPCDAKRPQSVTPIELPPVLHRGQPVTLRLDRGASPSGKGGGVRAWGECETCGALVTGERRFCGLCLAERMSSRRKT